MAKFRVVKGVRVKIEPSSRKGKQLMATTPSGRVIHFGDPTMKEYPGTKRGDAYCARSSGIKTRPGLSANDLSRVVLWNCVGKRSVKR